MRGIILSAGQGKRLLPLTAEVPKCVLQVGGQSLVERQIAYLMKCGIDQVTVVVGFGAEKVEQVVRTHFHPIKPRLYITPSFPSAIIWSVVGWFAT